MNIVKMDSSYHSSFSIQKHHDMYNIQGKLMQRLTKLKSRFNQIKNFFKKNMKQ